MNLLTRMKSPTSSVGRIDDDGILKGSARNERSRNTINRTGKNAFEYSTHEGSRSAARSTCSRCVVIASGIGAAARCTSKLATAARARARRRPSRTSLSTSHAAPVRAVSKKRMSAKFIDGRRRSRRWWIVEVRWPRIVARGMGSLLDLQNREKCLLGNFDAPHGFHPLLAGLLLFQKLLLARH